MADIRINSLPTTAVASSSDDFLALDGTTNGTRKLNAYSPTFGGNLTVNGTASAGTLTDGYITISAAQINRASNFVELQYAASGGVRMFGATATPITFSSAGNLTVGGTGVSSVAGTLNVTGALLAHQTAALNMAHEGSSLSQLVSYGADASTYGRLNITLRKAGTGVGAVTALALTSTDATFGGNLTVSGTGNNTFNSGGGNLGIGITPTLAKLEVRTATATTGAKTNIAFLGSSNAGGLLISHSNAGSRFHTDLTSTIFGSSGNDLDLNVNDGVGGMTIKYQGNVLIGTTTDSSNGKLQLATHTTSAGGIGFGTDVSLYRVAAGALRVDNTGAGDAQISVARAGVVNSTWYVDGSNVYLDAQRPSMGFVFRTNGSTTALTLDSGQNATFAGRAILDGVNSVLVVKGANPTGVASSTIVDYASGSRIISYGSTTGTAAGFSFIGLSSNGSVGGTRFSIDSAGDASFAGTIATQGGTASTPANAFATGTAGTIRWDASYIYVCTAANTWKRVAIAAW